MHYSLIILTSRPDTMMPNIVHPVSLQTRKTRNQKLKAGQQEDMTRRGVTLRIIDTWFILFLVLHQQTLSLCLCLCLSV